MMYANFFYKYMYIMNFYESNKKNIYNEYFKITNDEQYSAILTKIHFSKYTGWPSILHIKKQTPQKAGFDICNVVLRLLIKHTW